MEVLNGFSIKRPKFCSEVTKKIRPEIRAAVTHGDGDPMLTFDKKAAGVYEFLRRRGIELAGHTFGVYYLDRNKVGVENVEWEACVPIIDGAKAGESIEIKKFPKAEVVTTTLIGGYNLIGPALRYLQAVARANGIETKWPLTEIYLKEDEEPITELQFLIVGPKK